ncbi:MAG: FAD-dependent oxidoreductase, partial [Pseudonocardia sp.]|uniref:FAD-dependent oxidoreductase n=1 Tax=Pseudonocardia sp. TaxID=60912 RepID=UPI001ACC38A1
AVLDLKSRIAITRLGQRVRASGGADLGGSGAGTDPASLRRLGQVMSHWFPAAARFSGPQASIQSWRGALVMSDDGLPCIGASRLPGLWLNLAHGAAGWAMACGAARHLADAITHPSTEAPADAPGRVVPAPRGRIGRPRSEFQSVTPLPSVDERVCTLRTTCDAGLHLHSNR